MLNEQTSPVRLLVPPEPPFDLVAIASSYGGVQALGTLVSGLPVEFPVPLVLVQHIGARPSFLTNILERRTRLAVRWVEQGLRPRPRTLYIAPPDRHVELSDRRTFLLSSGPKVHHTRPAADPLLCSVARVYAHRALGVVLTGMGRDGAEGARAIRRAGGVVLVQDESSCAAFGMPGAVRDQGDAHFVLPLSNLAAALISLVMVPGAPTLFGVPRQGAGLAARTSSLDSTG
ncbi:chemotaxis protein CheB [Archangium violaceum]|uniref:chemotaxis protein CheB n=1 Tax=Archangium violaceum TaxID=83451 RepID=UPI0037C171E4